MRLLGAILAGGRATRFGSDKALALLDGRPLIDHAAAALRGKTAQIVVCGRATAPPGLIAVADRPAPDLGPLGGLCGALHYAAGHGFDAVLSIGCDMPLLPPELLDRLIADGGACFVRQAPVVGYWPAGLADRLAAHLSRGVDRSVHRWAASVAGEALDAGRDIPNINYRCDIARMKSQHPG